MKKAYLNVGEKILLLTLDARVGPSGTIVDVHLDASKSAIAKNTGDDGIGHVVRLVDGYAGLTHFGVHVEDDTGRLYIDEDAGE